VSMDEPRVAEPEPGPTEVPGDEAALFEPLNLLAELRFIAATPPTTERPETLPLASIVVKPGLFQPRGEDERHISELVRAIKARGKVEPVTVIQVGDKAVLIDGHHRLVAYELAKAASAVPVRYFEGTLEDAVLEAGRANSKAKLPMNNQDRQNYAWRLVLMGTYSKRQIMDAAAISDGQVAVMRRVKTALGSAAYDAPTWWRAQRNAKGIAWQEIDDDERERRLEELAQDYADRLSKEFSTKLANNPEVAARALSIHFGRRLQDLAWAMREHLPEPGDDEESDF
jgi:ParB-like chromosome segregation protein Spo0J